MAKCMPYVVTVQFLQVNCTLRFHSQIILCFMYKFGIYSRVGNCRRHSVTTSVISVTVVIPVTHM